MAHAKVRPYDFSKLKRLSRKFVDLSLALTEAYPQLAESAQWAQDLSRAFEQQLQLPFAIQYVDFEEKTLGEFLFSLSRPCATAELSSEPQGARVFLDIDFLLAKTLVHRLLGNKEGGADFLSPMSPMEEGVWEFLLLKLLQQCSVSPSLLGPVQFRLLKVVFETKHLGDGEALETQGCVFKFFVKFENQGAYVRLFFPHPLVEGLLLREDLLAGMTLEDNEALLEKRLSRAGHIKTHLWSEVGRVNLASDEKSALEKGDVILFDETFATLGVHGLSGKTVIRIGENQHEGLLAEVIDAEGKLVLKVLDYYGGSS